MLQKFKKLSWQHYFVLFGLSSANALASERREQSIYSWQAVPRATSYRGAYLYHGRWSSFLTTSTWLCLDQVSDIKIWAVDSQGEKVEAVTIDKKLLAQRTQKNNAFAATIPNKKKSSADTWDPYADDSDVGPVAETMKVKKKGPRQRSFLIADLGLGLEHISTAGGINSFSGSSPIGSTSLRGEWHRATQPWYAHAAAEAHRFQATDASSGTSKFLRADARLFVFYDLNSVNANATDHHFAFGLGVTYVQLPYLTVTDQITDNASLGQLRTLGVSVGTSASFKLSTSSTLIGLLNYQPFAFSQNVKPMVVKADISLQRKLFGAFFADFGGKWEWSHFAIRQSCDVADCQSFGQTTSNLYMIYGGLGWKI